MLFLTSLKSVALLLVMAIPGFIIAKTKMIKTEGAVSFLSVMLLYVCQPFVTFNSFLNTSFDKSVLWNLIAVFLFTSVLLVALIYIGKLAMHFTKTDTDSKNIVAYAGAFGNLGYMCIPFLQLLQPGNNILILYATSSVVAFNLISWTLGNFVLTGDKKFISFKRAVLNPPTLSFIIALPLFICNINFPRFNLTGLANTTALMANMVGPLAMTLLGIKLADTDFKSLFLDYRVYIGAGIKLLIAPTLGFLLVLLMSTFMNVSDIRLNLICLAAMPSANNIMMFSAMYGKDATFAAKQVVISTLLSCITIPLAIMAFV